jgi:hypothetical protein
MHICIAVVDLLDTNLPLGFIKHNTIKPYGEKEGIASRILDLVHQMEVSGELYSPADLPTEGKAPSTHCVGGWVGHRSSLDAVEKK